ncbi:MAG TPA: hypothetical protein DCY20_03305 [Firmicutes bacterium]|nr:hypothetical protein [Bacillota bacterium]
MRRKYTAELQVDSRIDLFIEENERLITKIKSISNEKVILDIDPKANSINKDKEIHTQFNYKATYYAQQDVYLFQSYVVNVSSDRRYITIKKPVDFYKVKRRQHVRGTWFSPCQYLETNSIERFTMDGRGRLLKGKELAEFKKTGYLLNLSGGGLELKLKEPVNSEFLIIRFKYKGRYLTYYGIIRRQSVVKELGVPTYRIGIEFINLTDAEREKTIKMVFERMRQIQKKNVL